MCVLVTVPGKLLNPAKQRHVGLHDQLGYRETIVPRCRSPSRKAPREKRQDLVAQTKNEYGDILLAYAFLSLINKMNVL